MLCGAMNILTESAKPRYGRITSVQMKKHPDLLLKFFHKRHDYIHARRSMSLEGNYLRLSNKEGDSTTCGVTFSTLFQDRLSMNNVAPDLPRITRALGWMTHGLPGFRA
jgi:hypothetical protein